MDGESAGGGGVSRADGSNGCSTLMVAVLLINTRLRQQGDAAACWQGSVLKFKDLDSIHDEMIKVTCFYSAFILQQDKNSATTCRSLSGQRSP